MTQATVYHVTINHQLKPLVSQWNKVHVHSFPIRRAAIFLFARNFGIKEMRQMSEYEKNMTACFHCSSKTVPAVCLIGGRDPVPGRHLDWWQQRGGSQSWSGSCCSSDHFASPHIHSAPRQLPGEHARHCHGAHQWVDAVVMTSPWPLIYRRKKLFWFHRKLWVRDCFSTRLNFTTLLNFF